nr:unnamed protein product [Spirometra erinaceieuropaei]
MDSVVWQNDKFASSASEVARKRWISKSFYWLTLNLILLLWISAVLSPANVLANIWKSALRDLAAHFLTLSIFIICLLSCFFHSFQLLRALRPFTTKAKGTFYPLSTPDRIFGPNVFSPLKREVSSSSLSGCDIKSWMQTKIQKSPIHPQSSWSPGEPENRSFSEFWFSTMQNEPLAYSPDQTTPPRLPMSSSFSSSFLLNTSIQNSAIGLEKSSAMDNSWSTALARPRWISSPLSSSLASFQYELSPSSDTKPKSAVDDRSLNSPDPTKPQLSSDPRISEQDALKYWKDNRVTGSDLERWTINIRRWLHGTIVRRVVDEITFVNAKILETSEDAALIGSTTLNTLEQLAFSKYRHISTLPTLIRFLNCTKDQGYLVSRLRELARGSFLEEFRWDGGSKSTTSPWKEHIPTDTLLYF